MKHDNSGKCPHCLEIINKYPNFDEDLLSWFQSIQLKFPNFHVAEAGRGRVAQEVDFSRGASRAHYGQSAHNYNVAMDTFFLVNGEYSLDNDLYLKVTKDLPFFMDWYGAESVKFYERPHFEKIGWEEMARHGLIHLVE